VPRGTQGFPRVSKSFAYGPITHYGGPFQILLLPLDIPHRDPTTPATLTNAGFGLLRVRSPLLAESQLISTPPGTEMFQFPGFASSSEDEDDQLLRRPGSPIRKPPDQSLFSGSPKLIAANRVLHRLSAPRHPPFALPSLTIPFSKATGSNQDLLSLQKNPYSVVKEQ
jgi:hypothetical protein